MRDVKAWTGQIRLKASQKIARWHGRNRTLTTAPSA
jgi:hypothetical protein